MPLQRLPSLHAVPLATATFWHPVDGVQLSVVQGLPSLQLGVEPAAQAPLWQVSVPLQALPSLQDVPFATGGFWQTPAVQTFEVQEFPSAQSLPLSQGRQPAMGALLQPVLALQVSVVQALPSSQSGVEPAAQAPLWQVSVPLQAFPSLQDVPLVTGGF